MLAHLVYFETLASFEDNTTPTWKSVTAGLVVLRLIDAWLDDGPQVVTTDVTQLRAIRESVEAIPAGDPIRSILSGMLDTMQAAETSSVRYIASQMLAYGRALHYAGQWKLARDVFETITDRAHYERNRELVIESSLRLGFVTRRLGELDASDFAYKRADFEARDRKDVENHLVATLGLAKNTIARGNLPGADEMLQTVITRAERHNLTTVLSNALHDRAHLSHTRKDYAAAVRHGYHALEFAPDALARERILGDIAASFAELGHLAAARDAHMIVAATTQEEWLRQQTMINLMEIAFREEQEVAFHNYRMALAKENLQPHFQAYYHLYAGQGFRRFGKTEQAETELNKALAVAEAHQINQLRFAVESELEQLHEVPVNQAVTATWSDELNTIATALGEMRELAVTAKNIGAA